MAQIKIDGNVRFSDVLVPGRFVREYMHTASGDHIKVYLMLLDSAQNGTVFDTSAIADLWETTEKDIVRSLNYWEKKGVIVLEKSGKNIVGISFPEEERNEAEPIKVSKTEAPLASENEASEEAVPNPFEAMDSDDNDETEDRPEVDTKIIITPEMYIAAKEDKDFQMLLAVTQTYFHKLLSQNDYELFLHFYHRMKCNTDICELIIESCADKNKLTMRNIEKISCELMEKGISDREAIKYYLNQKQIANHMIDLLGLPCKKLPAAQMNYLNKWFLEYHFSEAMVNEACNRGALKTNGDNAFPYIDSILDSWYKAGVSSLEEVSKKDEAYKEEQKKKYGNRGRKPSSSAGTQSTNKFNRFEQRTDIDFDEDELLFIADNIKKTDD